MREQITDGEIHDASAFATKASMYHCMPGIVVAYHAAVAGQSQPSVDVQPGTNDVRFDTDTGARIPEPWPTILGVPLAMAKGGGASIAFAMGKGDHVTLVAYDLDPSKHRGTGNAEDPVDTRRHGGGHWIALPFDITDAGAVADPGGDLVVTPPTGGVVVVGPGATDFAALASKVDTALSDLATWVKTGTYVPYPGGVAGAVAPLVFLTPFSPDSVAATKLKVL